MKKFLFLALLSATGFISKAQINGTIVHDGITRNYIIYLPTTYAAGQSLPLVFVLHGFTQSATTIMNVSDFNTFAEDNNFIVAYPQGINNGWNTNTGFPGGSTADDIGFIEALRDEFHALYTIDSTRVYSCGFSAGGYMSHRLACESSRCFAAIASVSGTMSDNAFNDCNPSGSTPIMQIHGTSDNVVSYNGGFGGKSVDEVIAKWVTVNSCPLTPVITLLPDINTNDGSTVEKSLYDPCADFSSVVLMKVIDGGHQWPGTTAILGGIGNINRDINASEEIWSFFSNFNCSSTTGISNTNSGNLTILPANLGNGLFSISIPENAGSLLSYSVVAMDGKTVLKNTTPVSGTLTIDLKKQAPGIYILSILSEAGTISARLIR